MRSPLELARTLGWTPRHPEWLAQALTHRSAGTWNNERLEFLGDAILGFVIAEALLTRLPGAPEGQLTRVRASLVNRESLAALARTLDLGAYLRLGPSARVRDSFLADALEALFAARYLDQGFPSAREMILSLYRERLDQIRLDTLPKDPKSRLQERLQAHQRPLPQYQVLRVSGLPHDRRFLVQCCLPDGDLATQGEDRKRRLAEQRAAERMLEQLDGP